MNTLNTLIAPLGVVGAIVLLLAVVILIPLGVIWSLNTLFGLGIAYTFKTWFAALFISSFGSRYTSK